MDFKEEELALLFALALATRPHTSCSDTINIAFDAAELFLLKAKERREERESRH